MAKYVFLTEQELEELIERAVNRALRLNADTEVYTLTQAAKILQYNKTEQVSQLIRDGKLAPIPGTGPGKSTRIAKAELNRFILSDRTTQLRIERKLKDEKGIDYN